MIAYQKGKSKFGSHNTLFNAHTTHSSSTNMNVKVVVLDQSEFNLNTIKRIIKLKSTGVVITVENDDFVPNSKFDEAYQFLRKF